jgi:hypothetical protein
VKRAAVLIVALLVRPGGAQPESLLWPLELQPALSSTFGETRSTAFHAGIDLKTWGKTGYAVHAVADGWILRVRTSPWGFGRALYERLADGRIAVYAHLEGFFEPVQERVQAAQRSARQYSVQLWFEEGEIPVRRGQVIARTGQSGVGPPHLHVEIRDADNVPLNPLQQGLGPVPDTTPPTLRRLLIVPLSAGSTVDGSHIPVVIAVHPSTAGFEASRPVRVWGRIGLAVDSHDRADLSTNKMAVLRHVLRVDGRTILTSTYERVAYADGHLVALDRLRPAPESGVFSALFRRPGNRLSFYQTPTPGQDGTLQAGGEQGLQPGTHEVVVLAQDVAGNRTSARLRLEVSAPAQIAAARLVAGPQGSLFLEADFTDEDDERLRVEIAVAAPTRRLVERAEITVGAGPFTWALPAGQDATAWSVTVRDAAGNTRTRTLAVPRPATDPGTFRLEVESTPRPRHVLLRVTSPRPLRQAPLAVAGGKELRLQEESPRIFTGLLPLDGVAADTVVVHLTAVAADGGAGRGRLVVSGRSARPGQARVIRLLEGDVLLHMAAGSAFEVLYPQATRLPLEASTPEALSGLHLVGAGCQIGPADAAFDERVRISMRVGEPTGRVGVYADDGQGRWVLLGAEVDEDGRLSAGIRAFGRFALMRDSLPPTISRLHPESGSVVEADVTFSAGVADAGSGIGREEDVVFELDGNRLISEYDPEAERVTASADESLAAGAHHLVLTLRDAAGNESVASVDFVSR